MVGSGRYIWYSVGAERLTTLLSRPILLIVQDVHSSTAKVVTYMAPYCGY